MAGTRLIVSSTFMISMLGVVAVAVVVGLIQHRDLSVTALLQLPLPLPAAALMMLLGRQGGSLSTRTILMEKESVLHSNKINTTISVPVIRILVPNDEYYTLLQKQFEKSERTNVEIHTMESEEDQKESSDTDDFSIAWRTLCSDDAGAEHFTATARIGVAPYDLILCDTRSTSTATEKMLVLNIRVVDSLIIASSATTEQDDNTVSLISLFHSNKMNTHENTFRRPHLLVTVIMDAALSDWKAWRDAINRVFEKSNWPIASGIDIVFRTRDLSSSLEGNMMKTTNSIDNGDGDNHVSQILDMVFPDKPSATTKRAIRRINVAIPSRSSNDLGQIASKSWTSGDDFYSILPIVTLASTSEFDYDQVLAESLSAINIYKYFNVPSEVVALTEASNNNHDGSFPGLFFKLWLQDMLNNAHAIALQGAKDSRNAMIDAPSKVLLPERMLQSWLNGVSMIEDASEQAAIGNYLSALETLEACQILFTETIMQDPLLLEPLDFPLEQYAAVFAPLIFPLFLPLLLGLVREFKRYQDKKKKKKNKNA